MNLYCKKSSPVLVGFATSHSGGVALCIYDTQGYIAAGNESQQ